jgi:uncharacterized protein
VHSENIKNSVSRISLTLELVNKGDIGCEMIRHLAPVTVSKIIKNLPIQDRVHRFKDRFVYIETGLEIGAEKPRTQFKSGDVAFMTSNGALCFFIQDSTVLPMSYVGVLKNNVALIESVKPGDIIILKK